MQESFSENIKGVTYEFLKVFYDYNDIRYNVTFLDNDIQKSFRMKWHADENTWKIQAQSVPPYVSDVESELGKAIELNSK